MRIDPLGESAVILRDLPLPASSAVSFLEGRPGVVEAWAAFDAVGVILDGPVDLEEIIQESGDLGAAPAGRSHTIPVLYDGEDLPEVARRTGIPAETVAELHATSYECRAVGFCPGFAYLATLPEPLAALPRRDAPRPRVAPGSVALAAGMTAVYPSDRPGGWWLVGRTPLTLVDEAEGYFPLRAGDRVAFVAIDRQEFDRRRGERL